MWDIVSNGQQAAKGIDPALFRAGTGTPGYNAIGWLDYGSQVANGRTSGEQGAEQQYRTIGSNFDWTKAADYLRSLGYTGDVMAPTGEFTPVDMNGGSGGGLGGVPNYDVSPQLTQWMADNGLKLRVNTGEAGSMGALFNAQGQQAGDGVTWSDDDDPGGWFGLAALAAGGVAGGAIAGAASAGTLGTAAPTGGATTAATQGAGVVGGSGGLSSADLAALHSAEGYGAATSADAGFAGLGAETAGGAAGITTDAGAAGTDLASTGSDAHFYQATPNGTGVQDLANMGGTGTPTTPTYDLTPGSSTAMQSAIDAATSKAGGKLIGAGLTAALAGGAAAGAAGAGGTDGTGGASGVAQTQQQLAQQQLAFNQSAYAAGQPTRDAATAGALQAQAGQLTTQTQQNAIAQKYANEDASTFAPLRQQIVSDAQGYDTAGRRADAMAGATSDVEQAYASANDANNRAMLRTGVTPGSGRMQSLLADQAIAKANSLAGATTGAVRNVENTGAQRMQAAAQLGAFLPGAQTSAASTGSAAGTAGANSGANAVATQGAGITNVNAGFSGATAANNSAGNLYQQATAQKNQTDAAYNATLGKLGGAVGDYLGSTQGQQNLSDLANWISDEKVKKNTGKRANPMQALAQIKATPVETGWSYDPAKGGPNDGGQTHTGPMAQSVRRTMGDSVAPGGKSISPVDMNGKLMAGMQALAAKVDKLEGKAKNRRAAA